jgi:hypothetical protein
MVRSLFLVFLLAVFFVLLTAQAASATQNTVFFIETVVPQDGASPSITMDPTDRPWIGYSVQGTMKFGVRESSGWSFETVPFEVYPKTGIVIDSLGSPAVCHWGSSGVLYYVHRGQGPWVSESSGEGYFPEASALAVGPTGRAYAMLIWSYHYYGYVTLTQRVDTGWEQIYQTSSAYWFNPIYAGIDLAIDSEGSAHAIVNPIGDEWLYSGPGFGAPFPDMEYFAIAVNSQNQPIVVYNVGNDIQIMTRESGLWAQFTIGAIDACGRMDLVIDADDIPHLAYCELSSGTKKVIYAFRSTYGGLWAFREIDEGHQVSIAVDTDNHPHMSYITQVDSPAGYDLRYATTAISVPAEKKTWGAMKAMFDDGGEDN